MGRNINGKLDIENMFLFETLFIVQNTPRIEINKLWSEFTSHWSILWIYWSEKSCIH